MRKHLLMPYRLRVRTVICAALAAAAGAAISGCESPLNQDYTGRGDDAYTQSLLVRAVMDANAKTPPVGNGTFNGGVREYVRVDQAGPSSMPAVTMPAGPIGAGGGPTADSPPTTNPSYASVSTIGMPGAALDQPEPTKDLSLRDAIARAAMHSLAIKVEGYNPGIEETLLVQQESIFDPVLFGSATWTDNDDPTSVASPVNGQSWQHQLGIHKLLTTGGTVTASVTAGYHDLITTTPGTLSTLGRGIPISITHSTGYTTNLNLSITQPLLRGFGSDVNEANIYLAQRDMRISLANFKAQAIKSVSDVEEAYWLLVQAKTNVDILQREVIASDQTYRIVQERPDATLEQKGQALTALERQRGDLLAQVAAYRAASDQLKAVMNDPDYDISSNILVNPTDKPIDEPFYFNIPDYIETALRQRPEMQAARLTIERSDIQIKVAKNGLLPQLDMTLSVQPNGHGPENQPPGGLDQAFSSIVNPMNSIDWSAGVKLEVPLGNRAAEGLLSQRTLERRQNIEKLMQTATTVVQDVKTNLRQAINNYELLQVRRRERLAAADEVEGILLIEDIRPKTPEFLQLKLQHVEDLAQAEQSETDAIINYNLAIMRLEASKGTLLEYNRISLDRPPRHPAQEDQGNMRILGNTIPWTGPTISK